MDEYSHTTNDVDMFLKKCKLKLCDILNHYNHLLAYHDDPEDFDMIYCKLNADIRHVNFKRCDIHSRHYSRRGGRGKHFDDDPGPLYKRPIIAILDKIHGFYYHSYDMHFRTRYLVEDEEKMQDEDEDEDQEEDEDWSDEELANADKFNGGLQSNAQNIYRFGQRFEYEDIDEKEEKDQYKSRVPVERKYANLKELLQNQNVNLKNGSLMKNMLNVWNISKLINSEHYKLKIQLFHCWLNHQLHLKTMNIISQHHMF